MAITNSVPIPASLIPGVPTPAIATLVPFAQLEQKQAVNNAIGDNNNPVVLHGKKVEDGFKGLMPHWMLVMGNTYANEQKFNGSNGDMGKFLADMSKMAILKQSFSKLVSTLGSFDALKSFLNAEKKDASGNGAPAGWMSQKNEIGSMSNGLLNEANAFTTNTQDNNAQQEQQEKSAEYNILCGRISPFDNAGQQELSVVNQVTSSGTTLAQDESTVGDSLAKIASYIGSC